MPSLCRVKFLPESFFEAIEENDAAAITRFISSGIDINAKRGYGTENSTPLTAAVATNNFSTVVSLIVHGAKVNQPGSVLGTTPLQVAARSGSFELVKLLVDSGADVNIADRGGATPLTVACEMGHLDIARFLLNNDAQIDHHTGHEVLPARVRKLLTTDNDYTSQQLKDLLDPFKQNTPLTKAAWAGNSELVKELLSRRCDITGKTHAGNTALHIAAREGHMDIVQLLCGYSLLQEKNRNFETPVFVAVRKLFETSSIQYLQIIEHLIQAGCDVSSKNSEDQNLMFILLISDFKCLSEKNERLRMAVLNKVLSASRTISHVDLPDSRRVSKQMLQLLGNPIDWLTTLCKSPRCLQHLCRHVIRDILSSSLAGALDDLPLTVTMKSYLNLQ